ncbi:putative bifunctional diguanylate cyclase/phosphodiesterase [Maricaulis sp. CAU 1757]
MFNDRVTSIWRRTVRQILRPSSSLHATYQPIVSGAALGTAIYMGLNTLDRVITFGAGGWVLIIASMIASLAAAALTIRTRRQISALRLELSALTLCGILIININLDMARAFEQEDLHYYLLLMPLFAALNSTIRAAAIAVLGSAGSFVYFILFYEPSLMGEYLSILAAGLFGATALMLLFRGAVTRAAKAQTRAEKARAEAETLAGHDALTGLPNRRSFMAELERRVAGDTPFGLLMIDLDGFKPVNDTYGHAAGDEVLREAARRLQQVKPREALAARLGGDEFAVVLPDLHGEEVAGIIGATVCRRLSEPYNLHVPGGRSEENTAHITGSGGISLWQPGQQDSAASLYEKTDFALYQAKQNKRGKCMVCTPRLSYRLAGAQQIEKALRTADLEAELRLVYQPQYDTATGAIFGFEALARWSAPGLGDVPASVFIPAAERAFLMRPITQTLLRKALAEAARWPDHIKLSFNLSVQDLMREGAIAAILSLVEKSGVAPDRLIFEITETDMVTEFESGRHHIAQLTATGASIAIDDFGVGYSNFSYLHELDIDHIKLDRSFVTRLIEDDRASRIVASLIGLARSLNLSCLVEGVETPEQLERLRAMGAPLAQGFLWGQPIRPAEIPNLLATQQEASAAIKDAPRRAAGG